MRILEHQLWSSGLYYTEIIQYRCKFHVSYDLMIKLIATSEMDGLENYTDGRFIDTQHY